MEAESSVEKDIEAKQVIMQRNRLDSLIQSTRRAMEEVGTSFTPVEQQAINVALNDAEGALSSDDINVVMIAMVKVEEAATRSPNRCSAAV